MALYIAVLCALFAIFLSVVRSTVGFFSATGLFGFSAFLMGVGTLVQVDLALPADSTYADIVAYSTAAFFVASILLTAPRRERAAHIRVKEYRPGLAFWSSMALSVVIVLLYFQAVGQSAFVSGLGTMLHGGTNDVADLRLQAYSGNRYLYPGYVNQFKNALLPALTIVAVLHLRTRPSRFVAIPALVGFTVFGLIGTGQRGAFIITVLILITFWALWNRGRQISVRALVVVGAGVASVAVTSTLILARNKALTFDSSWLDRVTTSAGDLVDRVVLVNQLSGIYGFRYTQSLPSHSFGSDWMASIAGLLPGNRGSDLSRRIFAMRYGSDRGTSPPSLWGSIHYNFGTIGTLVAPIVLAWLLAVISSATMRRQQQNALEAVGVAGVSAIFGMWVVDTPLFLLNSGIVVYALVWWLGTKVADRASPEDKDGRRRGPAGRRPVGPRPVGRTLAPATTGEKPREPVAQGEGGGGRHAGQREPIPHG